LANACSPLSLSWVGSTTLLDSKEGVMKLKTNKLTTKQQNYLVLVRKTKPFGGAVVVCAKKEKYVQKKIHLVGHVLNVKVVTLEGQVAGYLFDSLYLKVLNIFCILIKLRRF
jgi:hypothetical protein